MLCAFSSHSDYSHQPTIGTQSGQDGDIVIALRPLQWMVARTTERYVDAITADF